MQREQFQQMVARLERESAASPTTYQVKVAALALLGFVILGVIIGFAGLGLLLLVALVLATVLSGGKAALLLLKLGKLLVLLAVPLWMLIKLSITSLFTRLPAPQGVELQRAQAPALFEAMDKMRQRMKGPKFHHVLITDEVNAAVVQRPLFGLFGWPRNYLILGLPLLEALSRMEALAVVAHEYGHLAGSHSRFGAFIYRLRLTWATIQELAQQWQGWASRPLQRLVRWYAPYFNAYTFVLARANEYQADAASAELVGAGVAASALKRVNIVAPQYDSFNEQTFGSMRDRDQPPRDRSVQWAARLRDGVPADKGRQWLGNALGRSSRVGDTHPALRDRLRALPGQAELSAELPGPLTSRSAATAWLGDGLPALRETLQQQWHAQLAGAWAQRHRELKERLQRLEALEARDEPALDEQIERLRLRVELFPERAHLDALAAFNAEHAGQAVTLYLEACVRLDLDDGSGLALLERTMVLDPEATQPACERAHGFYLRLNDEARAREWQDRWQQRHEFESLRALEIGALNPEHKLRSAELEPAQLARLNALLLEHGKGIKRAYVARRVLPSDPKLPTYVLGLELTAWAGFRGQGQRIVKRLSAAEWPMHVFICVLDGHTRPLRKKIKALAGAQLALAD